jgi:Arc/MetJ-type ribon-helix-helix transcriptional regulator
MIIQLPEDVENSLMAEVNRGRFGSIDDALSQAWRAFLEQLRSRRQADATMSADSDEAIQFRLIEAGLLSEIKPPIEDVTSDLDRKAVPILGAPLSETVISERR